MPDGQEESGPRLVWTFPLVTRIQTGGRFLNLGNNLGSMGQEGAVRGKVKEKIEEKRSDDDDEDFSEDDSVGALETEIGGLKDSSETTFGEDTDFSAPDQDFEVDIQNGVFVPTRANVDVGTTVKWVNNDDRVHKISSIRGEEFTSGQIEPGEEFEYTFDEEGSTVYIDTISGGESMSGAVVVGDADSPADLPSESDTEPVTFSEEADESPLAPRSMSQAAEDKEQMDRGFDE